MGIFFDEIAVKCSADCAVLELKLWSILSAAATVNEPCGKTGGRVVNATLKK